MFFQNGGSKLLDIIHQQTTVIAKKTSDLTNILKYPWQLIHQGPQIHFIEVESSSHNKVMKFEHGILYTTHSCASCPVYSCIMYN
jgi:DNA-binding sugar fermentation-stimulating protein